MDYSSENDVTFPELVIWCTFLSPPINKILFQKISVATSAEINENFVKLWPKRTYHCIMSVWYCTMTVSVCVTVQE